MKQLFEHTSTLLRTALLLGAMILVNTQYTQAQTAEQRAAMPDAFETMNPADIIGDGKYYYIQFYNYANNICSYLTDCGANLKAKAKDFLPYTNNRLWTLETTGTTGQFRLKSKEGRYLGYISGVDGLSSNQYRFGCTDAVENAAIMTYTKVGDDYFLLMAGETDILYRVGNDEWATDLAKTGNNSGSRPYASLRFAKLKSNAAFIIYYRDGGAENSDPSASTIRHYLTYSDVDAASTVMASAVTNGSLEGADASSFFFGDPDHNAPFVASITDGAGNNGSRGIQITARGKDNPNDWDSQFFIRADEVIPEGTTFHLEFDYRASRNATVPTQAHSAPGSYITEMPNNNGINYLSFTTDWQHYSADIEVSHEMGYGRGNDKGNSFQSIAFNLWNERSTNPNTIYYFDNIKLTVPTSGSAVSSRRSIIPPDKPLSTLPTIAAYHQDGLWQLEEASADGKFYIKKYNSNEYLNCDLADPYAAAFAVLGPKDETHGQYSLVDPVASRYTLVQNVQYQTAALSPDMFYHWNGYGANASIDGQHGNTDFFFRLGQQLNSGDAVAGTGGVDYLRYADLTGYTTMIVKGTPGMIVRVLMNRQESNDGPYTLRELTIGNDGKVELDLTDLTYVHLNAIKIGWGNSGIISDIELVNRNQVNTSSPLYLNHSNGDGYPVMERNDDADNHWYAAFFPVEVPVPNKDEFYQVLVKWGDSMMAHDGRPHALPANEADYDLWQLEMVDDYEHFRLKAPNGGYLKPGGTGVTPANDPTDAENMTNKKFWTDFSLTWFYVNPVDKEIPVKKGEDDLYMVTHRMSYLKQYSQPGLDKQGLAPNQQSDWWIYGEDENDPRKNTQKTNHFEITHYVKQGNTMVVEFPTVLNSNNDHIYFQRFYNYDEADTDMDLDNLKAHVSLDTRDDGNVQYFLYKNGMVTGQKLDWTGIDNGGMARNALRRFNFTNSDGNDFTVAVDVSRYSDFTYENESQPLTGNLEEPSLTMRYLFYMKDAKEMATDLSSYTETDWEDVDDDNWMEKKEFHFPAKPVAYEKSKWVGYRGEFIGLRHVFADYWVFDGEGEDDDNLVSAVNSVNEGKIEVKIFDPNGTGIRLGGWNPTLASAHDGTLKFSDDVDTYESSIEEDFRGFYFYDKMSFPNPKTQYGDSRFVVFRYPAGGVADGKTGKKAYVRVYLNNNGTRYQLAQFTVIFDKGAETIPWKSMNGAVNVEGQDPLYVEGTDRDPNTLRSMAGKPIAKITFDYPTGNTYQYPTISGRDDVATLHDGREHNPVTDEPNEYNPYVQGILNSSPIPLTFDNTNYSFDGNSCNWGSYALVSEKNTTWGNDKLVRPADHATGGYNLAGDEGMQRGFLYIDASEQPGDICAVDFQGEFCAGDKLMCSGWISGSNKVGDYRCPGGITLTVKGERIEDGKKETIYRFCPGQCYELDNGSGVDGRDGDQVVWQQFYFEFSTTKKFKRYWMEVNNNCVSSNGGDFMLDNVEVFALVPEAIPEMNTPICIHNDASDMQLLKIKVGFDKILSDINVAEETGSNGTDKSFAFVFVEKDKFLTTFQTGLKNLDPSVDKTIAELETIIETGEWGELVKSTYKDAYRAAFNAAKLGDITKIWDSNSPDENTGAGVLNFHWNTNFSKMETYTFAKAATKQAAVFGETDQESNERFIVLNGNYPNQLPWKVNTDYYIIPYNYGVTDVSNNNAFYEDFNICSICSKKRVFQIKPPLQILSLESFDETHDLVVCEGKIPTILTNLIGLDVDGNPVAMTDLNYDWWLGDPENGVPATLENYHSQNNGNGIRLDVALSSLRIDYPAVTSLNGLTGTNLTREMVDYLQDLVDKGQLVLHQKSISVPAKSTSDSDPYFYLVACPIHDGNFDKALNHGGAKDVTYYCDEPQGLRMKVADEAPTLKCGFVKGENGYDDDYNYPDGDLILSIRLANKAQFEEVRHGDTDEVPNDGSSNTNLHYLWLPIRNAEVQSTNSKVITRAEDYNIYLASTDDPTWDKRIYTEMTKLDNDDNPIPSLPIVGKIVSLNAIDVSKNSGLTEKANNRLCVYFINEFDVREGYNYTLSLPFKEGPGTNTCYGTMLINLKIVPDYEVWTGAADNTDWNNDQNWRRADGNTNTTEQSSTTEVNKDELYVTSAANTSPLHGYTTNRDNYRTPNDRLFRKGFAPLYCTHVLMSRDEWGNAPVLYDALDGKNALTNAPFPNLRDEDGWYDAELQTNNTKATATPILKFDMQARLWDIWEETYGADSRDRGRAGDLLAEMYQINTCDEIAFQPGTELLYAHLLNYNSAWMEFELDTKRWYLLGSPLQGTISGEWYAPKKTAQQKTTYYDPVSFRPRYIRVANPEATANPSDRGWYKKDGDKYVSATETTINSGTVYYYLYTPPQFDRYNPAIYQRSWDKAKAVLYEVGADYATGDDAQNNNDDNTSQGSWGTTWQAPTGGADAYLDRLGYKPFGAKKANVAIKGIWSNTYNDAQVDYGTGGFSVMVLNHLKGSDNDESGDKSIIRLPKEDTMYDYYEFSQTNADDGGTDTYLINHNNEQGVQNAKGRALNRGRLKTDLLLPVSAQKQEKEQTDPNNYRYGDRRTLTRVPTQMGANALPMTLRSLTEDVTVGASNLGYYLVENPFPCGLDMTKFFAANSVNFTQEEITNASEGDPAFGKSTNDVKGGLEKKYWILTKGEGENPRQQLVQQAGNEWITDNGSVFTTANNVLAPGQGFFVEIVRNQQTPPTTITFTKAMQAQSRYGVRSTNGTTYTVVTGTVYDEESDQINEVTEEVKIFDYEPTSDANKMYPLRTRGEGAEAIQPGLVITAQRDDSESSALVMLRGGASNDFLPSEDTEAFITSDFENAPTVYTLCGRLATTINSIHDFRSLPIGVESTSDAPCTLTFRGVEMLGDSISFYDAVEQKLTPLESGMSFKVSGQTQNRYYLVRSLNLKDAAEETHLQIFTEGLKAKVIASTAEPITVVRCFDTAGRLIYTASPQLPEYSFDLPRAGVYIIEAETEHDRKTRKVIVK